jgi:hypothetical protein
VLQAQIAPLLTRPVGRPPHYVRRFYASFRYRAQSWNRAVRLQLHALAYNLANFLRTLALPGEIAEWSLTSLREKVVRSTRR